MNPMQLMQQFQAWKNQFARQNPGISPQDKVNELMRQGKISQQQFEQARGMASMLGFSL
mgnify:CR=1 FL=1